jgi:superfamily II DNA/RNA helicase
MPYSVYRQTARYGRGQRQGGYQHSNSRSRGPSRGDYINPARFIQSAKPAIEEEPYVSQHQFSDFAVHPLIHKNLQNNKDYVTPLPIQDQAIPVGLLGKDIVGMANTGTGKTVAFAVPVLHQLIADQNKYALIMAPTRELASQIEEQCRNIGRGSGVNGALLIGGVAMGPQLRDLRANPRIVIGTPGRIKDHFEQGTLRLSRFNIVVLDEVDRMLDMGFINDIRFIIGELATPKQFLFFSATVDGEVRTIIDKFSVDPVYITVKTGDTSDHVDQNIVRYNGNDDKLTKLQDILTSEGVAKTLIFNETHRSVEKLCNDLLTRGFSVDAIHGGKSQSQRERALNRFRKSQINILVATDVAARGIDVTDITHVINYSVPQTYGDYVHRIGRAGRANHRGYALTFVTA